MEIRIRNEIEADRREVERITREAFWDVYVPGCSEHYLAHELRGHEDFVAELDFVAEFDAKIVGNIMYTRSRLSGPGGRVLDAATFGPLSVAPEFQGQGIGSALVRHSIAEARDIGFAAVVIYGDPGIYCRYGFKSCRDLGVSAGGGVYPYALLVLELEAGILAGSGWEFAESRAFQIDASSAEAFDRGFEPMEKSHRTSQDAFAIARRAILA